MTAGWEVGSLGSLGSFGSLGSLDSFVGTGGIALVGGFGLGGALGSSGLVSLVEEGGGEGARVAFLGGRVDKKEPLAEAELSILMSSLDSFFRKEPELEEDLVRVLFFSLKRKLYQPKIKIKNT